MLIRAYQDREVWLQQCQAIGATKNELELFDADATRYAQTTPYPNSDVVAYCRHIAKVALLRGESVPASAVEAIRRENEFRLRSAIDRISRR